GFHVEPCYAHVALTALSAPWPESALQSQALKIPATIPRETPCSSSSSWLAWESQRDFCWACAGAPRLFSRKLKRRRTPLLRPPHRAASFASPRLWAQTASI